MTRVYRPEVGATEPEKMAAAARGELRVAPRPLSGETRALAGIQGVTVADAGAGRHHIAHSSTGEVVRFRARDLVAVSAAEVEAFLAAAPTYVWGPGGTCEECGTPRCPPADAILGRPGHLCNRHWWDRSRAHRPRTPTPPPPASPPRPTLRPCEPGGPMAAGIFRGGPWDDQRRPVPAHGPAVVRVHDAGIVHFYAWRRGTLRTYVSAGSWSP